MSHIDTPVYIGFLDEVESFKLTSPFFPSKVGHTPAWLSLDNIPTPETCLKCNKQLLFLLQVLIKLTDDDKNDII